MSMLRFSAKDANYPRWGATDHEAWGRLVERVIAYQANPEGFDWPDGIADPVPVSNRMMFARAQRHQFIREEFSV